MYVIGACREDGLRGLEVLGGRREGFRLWQVIAGLHVDAEGPCSAEAKPGRPVPVGS